ncbi:MULTISPECIES: DNA-formamidopyrimidine glycosylase [unclassified Mycoplasma]|uniref:DNA-formamidopyrimidine glycosylase n=1 Tax=unclassified Mycoplasma TaxID=2683645 RepID=UPI00211BDDFF|nr:MULTISPECIES: DNA-formamidopyrimidine glycosylase [unclassified Mycoplasma]UUM19565.1 DNA-formamidopyrimidine glycosylase [Mycoplasma sp. 1578d]UUM24484.1 DNA-formamidopyrimidine glycosylase [Mycoplasma sp. 3686d]
MPEYPEVTVVRKTLQNEVKGHKILNVKIFDPKFIKNASAKDFINFVKGEIIEDISNVGKFLVFHLSNNKRFLSHLRMEGKYYIRDEQVLENYHFKHDYLYFYLENKGVLAYNDTRKFGSFEILDPSENDVSIHELKNLAQLPAFVDVDQLYNKLQKSNKSIKTILLDQSLILGIGNIYADESLYHCNIFPMTKAKDLSKEQLKNLLNTAQEIMDQSIVAGGSSVHSYQSVNGVIGTFQNELKVYGKAKSVCMKCKRSEIVKVKLDFKPNGRGTSYCPVCQKDPYE